MTAQTPQGPRNIPVMPSVRGGVEKAVSEGSGLTVDLNPQRSAERWTPVLIATPDIHDSAAPSDSLPPVPLPGPMLPNAG